MTDQTESTSVHWMPRIALALFVAGLTLAGIAFAHVQGAGVWFGCAFWAWDIAYFLVLLDSWRRKMPIPSIIGVATYPRHAFRYTLGHAFVFLWGLLMTGMLLAATVMACATR